MKIKKIFSSLAVFELESSCVSTEDLKETQTTNWTGKFVPFSVFFSSNLVDGDLFLYDLDPQIMIVDFICNVNLLVKQSKLELRTKFHDVEVAIKERKKKKFDQLKERCKRYSSIKID